ncbi:helix-turn-helix domain-containing protein [Halalkalibacter sp. APA_J-10(15)]|uniref:GH39 family glycosyl hydrolase n=1 Tax=Halalkalibacter sp. APA_J-10(15) TaxID=2933805 RepID=UPI001FF5D6E2|nr:helix-turn-helix domain-containing protein [Halalkalibacter sp. APA_J-10(15)]MCK0472793.1 helix-turn-helix domain-containing protein [Halalkalibacter sp. APA_J-10(15)]
MEQNYEIIQYEGVAPLKLFIHQIGHVLKHWHKEIELLFLLEGEVSILINDKSYLLKEGDLILINSNDLHELHSDHGVLIALQINLDDFNIPDELKTTTFLCNSMEEPSKSYETIKSLIANMIQTNSIQDESTKIYNVSLCYALIAELTRNFKSTQSTTHQIKTRKHLDRLSNILDYVKKHYTENISLADIANREHLSLPYLSSFFNKYIGMNFTEYYDKIRIDYAVNDLLSSDLSIEEIALKHGFPMTRSFVRAFKKEYGVLPSLYRKQHAYEAFEAKKEESKLVNYIDFEPQNYLSKLEKYFNKPEKHYELLKKSNYVITTDPVNINNSIRTLDHTFKTFTSVGRAKELLYSEVQEMLTELQQTVSYRYIKFHGLLSDDMLVCRRMKSGQLTFSFVLIDKVIDFLLSIDLKPLIQLSFMPEALASHREKTIFAAKMNTSFPIDINEWNLLIEKLLQHLAKRYGRKELEEWLFCVWNEPDTSPNMFGLNSEEEFYELYLNTYQTVKSFHSPLSFGSPSLLLITKINIEWAKSFLNWTRQMDCAPDFLNLHYYANDFENFKESTNQLFSQNKLSTDDNNFNKYISKVKSLLIEVELPALNIYLTEWNLTVSHRNPINDTCFLACYLAKNLLENYDRLDSFGYWTLTDLIEEQQFDHDMFHGGLGLFTYNQVKKPHYYIFEFMNRLGSDLLAYGNGYFITKSARSIQIICYNYEHYSNLFADGKTFDLSHFDRYSAFPNHATMDISIPLSHLQNGNYRVKEYRVNQHYGSAYDKWVEMGSVPLEQDDINLLKNTSAPSANFFTVSVNENEWIYYATLEPLEVKFIEISLLET